MTWWVRKGSAICILSLFVNVSVSGNVKKDPKIIGVHRENDYSHDREENNERWNDLQFDVKDLLAPIFRPPHSTLRSSSPFLSDYLFSHVHNLPFVYLRISHFFNVQRKKKKKKKG